MITIADIGTIRPDPKLLEAIKRHDPLKKIFRDPNSFLVPGRGDNDSTLSSTLSRFIWPTGASRWAHGCFLVSNDQLGKIIDAATGSSGPIAVDMTIRDEQLSPNFITTEVWILPAYPLNRFGEFSRLNVPDEDVWVLPVVDERYFWRQKAAAISITEGTTTWGNLIDAILAGLGITGAVVDGIEPEYLFPPAELAVKYGNLPALLDAACYSVGRRLVRKLNGDITIFSPDNAATTRDELRASYQSLVRQGGTFGFKPSGLLFDEAPDTRPFLVPAGVTMAAPIKDSDASSDCSCLDADYTSKESLLSALGVERLLNRAGVSIKAKAGRHIVRTTAALWQKLGSDQNSAEIQSLCDQWATDWYKWQMGDQHKTFSTTVAWDNDAFADTVEWDCGEHMITFVNRAPLNDPADTVYHYAKNEYLVGDACAGMIGGIPLSDIRGYVADTVQLLGKDEDNCLKWFDVEECA